MPLVGPADMIIIELALPWEALLPSGAPSDPAEPALSQRIYVEVVRDGADPPVALVDILPWFVSPDEILTAVHLALARIHAAVAADN